MGRRAGVARGVGKRGDADRSNPAPMHRVPLFTARPAARRPARFERPAGRTGGLRQHPRRLPPPPAPLPQAAPAARAHPARTGRPSSRPHPPFFPPFPRCPHPFLVPDSRLSSHSQSQSGLPSLSRSPFDRRPALAESGSDGDGGSGRLARGHLASRGKAQAMDERNAPTCGLPRESPRSPFSCRH